MPIIVINFDTKLRRFWAPLSFNLFGEEYTINGVIDTGCTTSLTSGKDLFSTSLKASSEKLTALENKVDFRVGRGVYRKSNVRYKKLDYSSTFEELWSRDDLIFKYNTSVQLGIIALSNQRLFVGFDFECATLIGLDILENLNMYIGYDINMNYKFVACLKGDKDSELEFYRYLEDNFNLVQKPKLLSRIFRKEYKL